MFLREAEFVVFDVETTGLNPGKGDKICEIGAVRVKKGEVVSKFSQLVNPKRETPLSSINIHGISLEELAVAPFFEEVVDSFLEFIDNFFLLGYNIEFDLGFLNFELRTIGRKPVSNIYLDILELCRRFLNLKRYNLFRVAEFFSLSSEGLHRAYKDALTSAKIFLRLIPYLEEKGFKTLEELCNIFGSGRSLLNSDSLKIKMVQKALRENLKLKIRYYSFSKREFTEREVLPQKLELRGKKYFLIGECLLRSERRSFNLDNIIELEVV
ncbi:MAG: WYL domain-containing protein [Candidatus Omnitrophica bacterium]|nr:WYL domain-containing protein [Candidatus Omnitrophota bacterium]